MWLEQKTSEQFVKSSIARQQQESQEMALKAQQRELREKQQQMRIAAKEKRKIAELNAQMKQSGSQIHAPIPQADDAADAMSS